MEMSNILENYNISHKKNGLQNQKQTKTKFGLELNGMRPLEEDIMEQSIISVILKQVIIKIVLLY